VKVKTFDIRGPLLLLPEKHTDTRGFFAETFRKDWLESSVGLIEFVQDNQSYSSKIGAVRGLHFQIPPTPQAKLVRVVRGAIADVAVDLRSSSPTYGLHVATILSAENFAFRG
jgi:dTDP-4-dehydrorhamnose 3,5-epimerase